MRFFISVFFIWNFVLPPLQAQNNPESYKIYNYKGKEVDYKKMMKEAYLSDVVFFGEFHNNPICHWLQLEVTRDLYAQESNNLVLGGEMFETDNQLLINEYFLGFISEKSFEKEMRLWNNYQTDYKPLLKFAKENGLRFVATNIPRRYASMVFKVGMQRLDELPSYSKIYIAELPIEQNMNLSCYSKMLEMGNGDEKFPHAQMIKDATMAYFIYNNRNPSDLFLHYNGTFHSDYKEGIIWYLRKLDPNIEVTVISTVEQDDISELDPEHYDKGDFIICIPSRMTKTY